MSLWWHKEWLGTRQKKEDGSLSERYEWKTYAEVWNLVVQFGSGFSSLVRRSRVFLGIYSTNRVEWVVSDLASVLYDHISVPLPATLDQSQLLYILNHAEVQAVICSKDLLPNLVSILPSCPTLKYIIQMESLENTLSLPNDVVVVDYPILLSKGSLRRIDPMPNQDEESMMTILYTSGSTGRPKGAMNSFARWNAFVTPMYLMPHPLVRVTFNSLAHATERQLTWLTLCSGGKQAFHSGDMNTIFDEYCLVRPTQVSAPPRLYSFIHSRFQAVLKERQKSFPPSMHEQIENKVLEEFSSLLGGSVQWLIVGGASSSPQLRHFLERCFKVPIYDGYGTTEAGSIAVNNCLFPSVIATLLSIPEMGYTTLDKPYPRGEILVKTEQMISGYYKDEISTCENFFSGWFKTGDIGELRDDGCIYIIDRCKSVFKMSQGLFVEPSRIENIILESPFVEQIYVHGDGQSTLVAIVVPNESHVLNWASQNGLEVDLFTMYLSPEVVKEVSVEIARTGLRGGLRHYEIPSMIYLEKTKFSPENGLLTISYKLLRRNVANHYKDIVSLLYNHIEEKLQNVSDEITHILRSSLNNEYITSKDDLLKEIGTDSLSTVKLASILKAKFNKEVPLSLLYNSSSFTASDLAHFVVSVGEANEECRTTTFHPQAEEDYQSISLFEIDIKQENKSPVEIDSLVSSPDCILLTGATGFLGGFLLCELLSTSPQSVVYCLVRCNNTKEGMEKIRRTFDTYLLKFETNWEQRIQVIVGDLEKPWIGLSQEEFLDLSKKIDVVYHCGAIVNWLMRYSDLRKANFLGTKTLLQFASLTKVKPFYYISTISTAQNLEKSLLSYKAAFSMGHYGLSKWIAEQLVLKAAQSGLPYIIYRPGMITGHSQTGACNKSDFTSRLISGFISLESYFSTTNLIELMPVDYVAKSIVSLSKKTSNIGKTFHITNPNSLTYTQLGKHITSYGYNMNCIDYAHWRQNLFLQSSTNNNSLSPLLSFFPEEFTLQMGKYDRECFLVALKEVNMEDCPPITVELVHNCLSYLVNFGFLPKINT